MHCASLLHKIFALLVYTNERVHIHNKRNFRQAKLYIKINVPLLLKEHSDLYFYRIITEYILSSLIKKIIFFYHTGKKTQLKTSKYLLLWNANYDRESNNYLNALCPRHSKWCDFVTNFMWYCSICSTLSTCQDCS